MEEDLGVQGFAGVRIAVLRRMAEHAHIHAAPRSAVRRQLVVAGVAAGRADDVVDVRHRRAIGDEIVRSAGVIDSKAVGRQVSRSINADGMRGRCVEAGGRRSVERVLILPRSHLRDGAAGVRARLLGGGQHRARRGARRIGRIVLLAIRNHRGNIAQADQAGRGDTGRIERQAIGIRQGVGHCDRTAGGDGGGVYGNGQAGPDELDRRIVREKCLLMRGI